MLNLSKNTKLYRAVCHCRKFAHLYDSPRYAQLVNGKVRVTTEQPENGSFVEISQTGIVRLILRGISR